MKSQNKHAAWSRSFHEDDLYYSYHRRFGFKEPTDQEPEWKWSGVDVTIDRVDGSLYVDYRSSLRRVLGSCKPYKSGDRKF